MPRIQQAATLLVLLLACCLRFTNLGFGLDAEDATRAVHDISVDERGMVAQELELLSGDWHPETYLLRGTAAFYVFGLADYAAVRVGAIREGESWDEALERARENPSQLFLVHRALSALAGVLTVWVLMRLCRRELGARCGFFAGLVSACAFLPVVLSHVGLVDVPWVLFAALAIDRILLLIRDPRRGNYLLAGLWIGIAGATKYPGLCVAAHLFVGHLLARARARETGAPRPSHKLLAAALLPLGCIFVALSAHLFFWPEEFLAAAREQLAVHRGSGNTQTMLGTLAWHARYTLALGLGEPALALALLGLVLGGMKAGPAGRVALFALLLIPTAIMTKLGAPRFGLGLLMGSVPLAALGLEFLARRSGRVVAVCLVVLVLLPALFRSASFNLILGEQDTRAVLVQELAARGADSTNTLALGFSGLPQVPGAPRPYVSLLGQLRKKRTSLEEVLADPPLFFLFEVNPKLAENVAWRACRDLVAVDYEEVLRLSAWRNPGPETIGPGSTSLMRLFVPFATPWQKKRLGPEFDLYRRKSTGKK